MYYRKFPRRNYIEIDIAIVATPSNAFKRYLNTICSQKLFVIGIIIKLPAFTITFNQFGCSNDWRFLARNHLELEI